MPNAFSFKSYYNPYISPTANSFWGVVSVAANETPTQTQATAISLICDVSGSMQGAKFNGMIETVESLLMTAPNDLALNVVVFDNHAHEILPLTQVQANTDRNNLVQIFRRSLRQFSIFGGTSMSLGIMQAITSQSVARGDLSRYGIFLTDGQNTEPEAQLAAAVKRAAETGMHLCAYGYGNDWDPKQLTKIAEITQGWMPKAVPNPSDLQQEFSALVNRMSKTVATDVALQLWTPTGARILSLAQAYPQFVKGEAAATGDGHTWVVPVPPMSSKDHRDYLVHLELASVGARMVAVRPSVVYVASGQKIEEKGDQDAWIILQQSSDSTQLAQINPVVAGYLGQGQLADATRAMTAALDAGDRNAAEQHRTEALGIAQTTGNKQMTQILQDAAKSDVARKTVALGTSTVSLTEEENS